MTDPSDLAEAKKTSIENQNTTGGSTTSGGGSYAKIGEADMTVGGDGEYMTMTEENKTIEEDLHQADKSPKEGSDDSDELDDEISKLEQSMAEDDDDDTDEDQNQEEPDFSVPSQKHGLSRGSTNDSAGLGAHSSLRESGSQPLNSSEQDIEDTGTSIRVDPYTATEDTFEIENDGLDFGAESSRKSLAKKSDPGDIEMQTVNKKSPRTRK